MKIFAQNFINKANLFNILIISIGKYLFSKVQTHNK